MKHYSFSYDMAKLKTEASTTAGPGMRQIYETALYKQILNRYRANKDLFGETKVLREKACFDAMRAPNRKPDAADLAALARLFSGADRRDNLLDVLKPYESDKMGNLVIPPTIIAPTFRDDLKVSRTSEHGVAIFFPFPHGIHIFKCQH